MHALEAADDPPPVFRDSPARIAGHPVGVFVLFLAEMWERFSYYGMRALLIFYLLQHFHLADAQSTAIYGAYTALVYGACLVGGALSDRLFGQWRSVQLGACLIMAGHVGLAVDGTAASTTAASHPLFFLALGLIIAGTGLFKPSSTALVGALYRSDAGRQTGYYLFYMGLNLGAALAALVAGYLGQTYGWSYGFGAAAVGMALGLATLQLGRGHLRPYALPASTRASMLTRTAFVVIFPLSAGLLLQMPPVVGLALLVSAAGALVAVGRFMRREALPAQRNHLLAIMVVLAVAALFWSLSEQAGSSLALFADRAVELRAGSLHLTSSQTQFFNPAFILLGTPLFTLLWAALARRGREPAAAWKLVLGLVQAALGFAVLVIGIHLTPAGQSVALIWLVAAYLLSTSGELSLSPTAMSELARLAPQGLSALVMGLWLFSLAAGNYLGGEMAGWITTSTHSAGQGGGLEVYAQVFSKVACIGGGGALLLALGTPWLKRKMEAI
jgi:POT family proton-dependent oligopeptide transporter